MNALDFSTAATPPPLSIVMPVLNEAAQLGAVLQRLTLLRERGAELIVVDGGSSDGSADFARPLSDKVIVAPRGRASQVNAGAGAARGGVLLFLHADTQLPPAADHLILDGLVRYAVTLPAIADISLTGVCSCLLTCCLHSPPFSLISRRPSRCSAYFC